jgi:hypothetical protein
MNTELFMSKFIKENDFSSYTTQFERKFEEKT